MTNFIPEKIITGEQIRSARAMLRLDQKRFATLTHLTVGTIRRMERTRGPLTSATEILEAVRIALEAAGVELIDAGHYEGVGGPGIRLKGEPVASDNVVDFETDTVEIDIEEQAIPGTS